MRPVATPDAALRRSSHERTLDILARVDTAKIDVQCIDIAGAVYRPISDPDAVSTLSLAYRKTDRNRHLLALIALLKLRYEPVKG